MTIQSPHGKSAAATHRWWIRDRASRRSVAGAGLLRCDGAMAEFQAMLLNKTQCSRDALLTLVGLYLEATPQEITRCNHREWRGDGNMRPSLNRRLRVPVLEMAAQAGKSAAAATAATTTRPAMVFGMALSKLRYVSTTTAAITTPVLHELESRHVLVMLPQPQCAFPLVPA